MPVAQTERLLTAKEAAHYLHVSLFTLNRIEQSGGILPYRTPGGHRRYSINMLDAYLEKTRRQRLGGASATLSPSVLRSALEQQNG